MLDMGFREDIETILNRLKKTDKELTGMVSIGMPIEFGNNVVLPLLTEFQKKNPKVQFKIRQGFPFEMNHLLLAGELDAPPDKGRINRGSHAVLSLE